jgi:tripeptidyl-peptidase-1
MHEKRAHEPLDWALARRAEPDRILPLRIGLTQSNLEQLEDLLMAMSHPESPDYGKHWTPARVVEHFAPAPETVDKVAEWLRNEGIAAERVKMSPSRGWIEVANATVKEVEELLGTEYHIFTHDSGVEQISTSIESLSSLMNCRVLTSDKLLLLCSPGCERYHVPSHLTPHIDLITPTVHFNHRVPSRSTPAHKRQLGKSNIHSHLKGMRPLVKPLAGPDDLSNCDAQITPACLRALYNVDYTPVATAQNSYGIGEFASLMSKISSHFIISVEFTPQAFLQNDLSTCDLLLSRLPSSDYFHRIFRHLLPQLYSDHRGHPRGHPGSCLN